MTNYQSSKLISDTAYQDNLREVVAYIVANNDQANAFSLYRRLERAVAEIKQELAQQPLLNAFYRESLLSLAFLCLPALEDREVENLLRHSLMFSFQLPNYNLSEKMGYKLVNIISVSDRVVAKDQFRKAILENVETITPKNDKKTVKDWLLDYISKVGLESQDKLAFAQYLISLKSDKEVSAADQEKLTAIFRLYNQLSLSSDTPEGFEEELPLSVAGRLYIWRQGVLEPIDSNKEFNDILKGVDLSIFTSSSTGVQDGQANTNLDISSLESELQKYSEESLEYKALKQEISRLKAGSLRELRQQTGSSGKNPLL